MKYRFIQLFRAVRDQQQKFKGLIHSNLYKLELTIPTVKIKGTIFNNFKETEYLSYDKNLYNKYIETMKAELKEKEKEYKKLGLFPYGKSFLNTGILN